MVSNGNADAFLCKYDSDGNFTYGYNFVGSSVDQNKAITLDDELNIFFAGFFSNSSDFDFSSNNNSISSNGAYDYFFAKYYQVFTPTVATSETQGVNRNTIKVGVSISFDGNSTVTQKGVVWGRSENPNFGPIGHDGYSTNGGGTASFQNSISNLSLGTTYYIRAYATNGVGTSYGEQVEYTTDYSVSLDGNKDGILDSDQSNVHTTRDIYGNDLITIVGPNGSVLSDVSVSIDDDDQYSFPFGQIEFKLDQSSAIVDIIYHGSQYLSEFEYRKVAADSSYFTFSNVTYYQTIIAEEKVSVARLTLTDGGVGDKDGEVNGVIYDPGGPAFISGGSPVPNWNWIYMTITILIFSLISIKYYKS